MVRGVEEPPLAACTPPRRTDVEEPLQQRVPRRREQKASGRKEFNIQWSPPIVERERGATTEGLSGRPGGPQGHNHGTVNYWGQRAMCAQFRLCGPLTTERAEAICTGRDPRVASCRTGCCRS